MKALYFLIVTFLVCPAGKTQNLISNPGVQWPVYDTTGGVRSAPAYAHQSNPIINNQNFNEHYFPAQYILVLKKYPLPYRSICYNLFNDSRYWFNPDSITQAPGYFPIDSTKNFVPLESGATHQLFSSLPSLGNTLNYSTPQSLIGTGIKQCLINNFDVIEDDNFVYNNRPDVFAWLPSARQTWIEKREVILKYRDSMQEFLKARRTYFGNELTEPLIKGKTYMMSFWVSTKDYVPDTFFPEKPFLNNSYLCASNGLGIAFTTFKPRQILGCRLPLKPQWECPEIVNYKSGTWKKYTFKFIADSAYQFMIIGNFKTNAQLKLKKPVWASKDTAMAKTYQWYDKGRTSAFLFDSFSLVAIQDTPKISGDHSVCQGSRVFLKTESLTQPVQWRLQGDSTIKDSGNNFSFVADSSVNIIACNGILCDTFDVTVSQKPQLSFDRLIDICNGEDSNICIYSTSKQTLIQWKNGVVSLCKRLTTSGYHSFEIKEGPCLGKDSVLVRVKKLPSFSISQSDTICMNGTTPVTLKIKPETFPSVCWLPENIFSQTYRSADTGKIEVKVTDTNGCSNTRKYQIISDCPLLAFIPDAFTPDADGINDQYLIQGINILEIKMSIYNRWGELVFSSDNIQTGWDGTYKGEPAPQDIYLVRLMLKAKPGINFHTPFKFYEYTLTLMR